MHSAEFNRAGLALLGSILFAMLLVAFSNLVFAPERPAVPGFALPSSAEKPAAAAAAAPKGTPLPDLLAKADAKKGEQIAKVCSTCHNFEKGQGPKIGPDLWGVVGRPVASEAGFAYSDSIKKIGGDWTYEKLNDWIKDPKAMASDTKMTFPGEKDDQKRADVLAYLQTLASQPVPFPKPSAAPAAAAPAAAAAPGGTSAPAAAAGAPGQEPLSALLASADPKKGEQDAKICEACHNVQKGQGPKIGPPLWDVVGRPVASVQGFAYSDSIKKIGGDWSYEKLNNWITDPKAMAPDTKMIFPGEHSAKKRADILAYLKTLSDKPVPFPKEASAK
ncbi:MAG TPA: cytochrome c family protein [Roseiarcus sp.]|nr:cytochrome c family protein [Roseiarcus sp.]